MNNVFVFKPKREHNNLEYVPYFRDDDENEDYEIFNISKKLEKLGKSQLSDIICQSNVTNDFVRTALGFDELLEYYKLDDDDTISLHDSMKGVDILIVWTDTKQEETNKKKRLQSLRGLAGLYIRTDKKGDKYAEVAIICNAPGSKATTRKENIKKRGKEILNLIEELAKGEDCKYMALKALDNVITYYHKFGYKLVQHPFDKEKKTTTNYVDKLLKVTKKIDKVNKRKSTSKDRKKNREKELIKLHKEKTNIMNYLKRYIVGLHNVQDRANFKYDEEDDEESPEGKLYETGKDYVEDLLDNGYRMYKPISREEAKAKKKTRKRKRKKRTKKKTLRRRRK